MRFPPETLSLQDDIHVLETLQKNVLEQFCTFMETENRRSALSDRMQVLEKQILGEIQEKTANKLTANLWKDIPLQCNKLEQTTALLQQHIEFRHDQSKIFLQKILIDFNSVTKNLSDALRELEHFSTHDPVTELHNRRYFNEILDYEIERSARYHHAFSLLMMDVDNFKFINDTYGHLCGDEALRVLGKTLQNSLRKGDVIARIGGDEFAVLLIETPLPVGEKVAEKLRKQIASFLFEGLQHRFYLTISIGVVSYPKDGTNGIELMSGIDMALYSAKEHGKNVVHLFDSTEPSVRQIQHLRPIVATIKKAFDEDKIVPFFQPIVHCKTGELFAFEVLARLYEPDGKVIPAEQFIEWIEKSGLSAQLNHCIISKALQAQKKYQKWMPRLFFNLSSQELQNTEIVHKMKALFEEHRVSPRNIVFELLERNVITSLVETQKHVNALRKERFSFALDDFGSGYNTFHYLHDLHFDYVKLSGATTRNILHSKTDFALVRRISELCNDLNIVFIVEGVESSLILEKLQEINIPYVQGYHLGRPTPNFEQFLKIEFPG